MPKQGFTRGQPCYIVTWIIFLFCQVGEQIEAFVTYVTPEGHVFIQIHGGGTTRLNELMEDIAEHYSQVNLVQNYYPLLCYFPIFGQWNLKNMLQYCMVGHGKNMHGKWKNKMAALQDPHLATFLILGLTYRAMNFKVHQDFFCQVKKKIQWFCFCCLSFMQAGFDQYYA